MLGWSWKFYLPNVWKYRKSRFAKVLRSRITKVQDDNVNRIEAPAFRFTGGVAKVIFFTP